MLFITHAITGAALGAATESPYLGFGGGIVLHHALDWLPHNDPGSYEFIYKRKDRSTLTTEQLIMAMADVLLGTTLLVLIILFAPSFNLQAMLAGAFGGVFPDLVDNLPRVKTLFRKTGFGRAYHAFHERFHVTLPWSKWPMGLGLQVALVAISLYFFWHLS
jgi:hypothetical protein